MAIAIVLAAPFAPLRSASEDAIVEVAEAHGAPSRGVLLPLLLRANALPDLAVLLRPLDDFADDATCIVDLAALADGALRQLPVGPWLRLVVALLHDAPCDLLEHRWLDRHEGGARTARREILVANVDEFVQKQIVEHAVAALHYDVALIRGHAMHRAAPLDDVHRDTLVEVWVDPVVNASHLKRRLGVSVDTLHFRVEDSLERSLPACRAPQDEELTISYRHDGDHGVQLAMDTRAVIQDGQQHRRGAKTIGRHEGLLHHRDRAEVRGVLPHRLPHCVGEQLLEAQLVARCEEFPRQLRRVDAEILDL
mmetsp:Transcript_107085/g.301371  ORF Transcript_107085/g.301371 Transcript_107085/m.301371 type:complete len:309 (+) Transcript_107085:300-1226(+)